MSSHSSGDRDRQGQGRGLGWDPGSSSSPRQENRLDPNAQRFEVQQFRHAPIIQVTQQQGAYGRPEEYSVIQSGVGIQTPHSRLTGYTSGPSIPMPQAFQGQDQGSFQFQPIPQSYSQPFQSLHFQSSNEMPPYTNTAREQVVSPWGQSISPQWSWPSNVASSPSSQRSTPQHTPRWGGLSPPPMPNPNRPQSALQMYPQIHTLLPAISSTSLDNTRRGALSYNQLRPSSRSHGSFARVELDTSSTHDIVVERSASREETSPVPFGSKPPAPLPQNLRGDPFRSAKVKTELCRHYNSAKGCAFGDKCNYAHGEDELKFNKLMDLEREKLIDVEVFRTHPCFSWIATGACPFDQRCTRLHDPRINGLQPSWLPHNEVLITHVSRGLNVDKMYHQQFCAVYNCSPVYGFAPKKRWQSDESSTRDAWHEFYSFCCSLDSKQPENGLWPVRKPDSRYPNRVIPEISEMHRVEMALKMRERQMARYFTFLPSHQFCGELCMVLQTSYFMLEVVESYQHIKRYQLVEITEEEASRSAENPFIITAREITFGPVADASVRPVSVWFNIPGDDLSPCTRQQARRHKRSRHRLRQKRDFENQPEQLKISSSCSVPPFNCCQPVDDAAFDLVTKIMSHRLQVLKYFSSSSDEQMLQKLTSEEESLLRCFESQRRFWVTWTWPKRTGSNYIDDNTDVPDIDGAYSFVTYGNRAYGEDAIFFGVDQPSRSRGQHPVISDKAKLATGLVWKSFIMNLQLVSERGAVEVPTGEEQMPDHDPIVSQMRRIRTLRNLSMGRQAVRNSDRTLPSLNPEYCTFASVTTSLDGVLREWSALQYEYEENSSNPLKEAQMDKDKPPDPDRRRSLSYQYDEAAKLWTRSLPEYTE